jgi:hypothetical protein
MKEDYALPEVTPARLVPWNKGMLVGAKPPL